MPSSAIVLVAAWRMAARLSPVLGRAMAALSVCSSGKDRNVPEEDRQPLGSSTGDELGPTESFVTISNGAELLAISALASASANRVQDISKDPPIFHRMSAPRYQ